MTSHAQPGILDRSPEHLLLASLRLVTADPAAARQALEQLRSLIEAELSSDLADTTPQSDKTQPSAETGELGFQDGYRRYGLTVTIGFAKSCYDTLGVVADQQPQDLIAIPWTQLGDTPQLADNGDVLLQIRSESAYVNQHVVRRVEHELGNVFGIVWTQAGEQRHSSRRRKGPTSQEGRALIGFLDGTSNLHPYASSDDAKLVFVDPDACGSYPPVPVPEPGQYGQPQPAQFPGDLRQPPSREPEWTRGGSYCVVRSSLIDTSRWDQLPLDEQEHAIGRFKVSGSALDHADDPAQPPAEPSFDADAAGAVIPLTAHIRKANPRGPQDADRRIFRRGYPLLVATPTGLERGLIFVGFSRTISTQFEFAVRAWMRNPDFPTPGAGTDGLLGYEQVLCGGYFFMPPLEHKLDPTSWRLP
jgi:deferrochelatase/peroxidase EfeB